MQLSSATRQRRICEMAAVNFVLILVLTASADPPPGGRSAPTLPAAEVVKAWKDAGATVARLRVTPLGYVASIAEKDGNAEDLPLFWFRGQSEEGQLAKLPDPGIPYGLKLSNADTLDAQVKELGSLAERKNLQGLDLGITTVTDGGLKEVAKLKHLRALSLDSTKVTDAGMKELVVLESLQSLDLRNTQVGNAGLKDLAGLTNLQTLSLYDTRITDEGLKELTAVKNLRGLALGRTKVTDAGLKDLARIKNLRALSVSETKVTDAGINELRLALPACEIRP